MNMSSPVVAVVAGALVGLSAMSIANARGADGDDAMLASVGEFELGNGESQSIAHHNTAKEYRVCVKRMRHSVPLKVMYDGKEEMVGVGNCADFEAMNIRIAPAAKLDQDMVLIGRYHRLQTGQ